MNLMDKLTLIEEALNTDTTGIVSGAMAAMEQVEQLQKDLMSAKINVQRAVAKINGGLAMAIRQARPGLNISLEKENVTVGSYARSLRFRPDLNSGVWVVESNLPKIATNFLRKKGPVQLSDDFLPLAQVIAGYFTNYYKSLGENITGTGKLILDGRISNVSDLAAYIKG